MRLLSLFKKMMLENFRDWKILVLTLLMAPFFVVIMYFYFQSPGAETFITFDLYVPALLVLALISLMFTAAATLIKEKDKGTLIRLRLSNMTVGEFFTAVSLVQVIIGLLALVLTYLTALAFGYKTSGSLVAAALVGVLSSLAVIAVSLIVAAFLRTIFDLMTVGCFPFFILMFFSGGMMPMPPLKLFALGGHVFNVNDILPTTHSIKALGKVLGSNAGLGDVMFEITAIIVLTIVYFAIGYRLFKHRHLQPK
ncbi:MAG: ABC transporter permease [bacterium]|nr:ABC transporter permease [bacterium]